MWLNRETIVKKTYSILHAVKAVKGDNIVNNLRGRAFVDETYLVEG